MKYLFFDIEKATSQKNLRKICEFGYVVVDENFTPIEEDNFIINPDIPRNAWDYYVVKNILTRKKSVYLAAKPFPFFYPKIRELLTTADAVVGHSTLEDANAVNNDCKLYKLPNIDYDFFDLKAFYKKLTNNEHLSLSTIMQDYGIKGDQREHDAHADAFNTMLAFKTLLAKSGKTFEMLCSWCPEAKDRSEKYKLRSVKEREDKMKRNNNNRLNVKKPETNMSKE